MDVYNESTIPLSFGEGAGGEARKHTLINCVHNNNI